MSKSKEERRLLVSPLHSRRFCFVLDDGVTRAERLHRLAVGLGLDDFLGDAFGFGLGRFDFGFLSHEILPVAMTFGPVAVGIDTSSDDGLLVVTVVLAFAEVAHAFDEGGDDFTHQRDSSERGELFVIEFVVGKAIAPRTRILAEDGDGFVFLRLRHQHHRFDEASRTSVFVGANIRLDVLADGEDFHHDSGELVDLFDEGEAHMF